jgi:hypothetical protein
MKKLHALVGDQVHFVDVLIRQAHPGPKEPPYESFDQKMEDAQRYGREEQLPWPVLVDDLAGMVHQVYGGLADPTYLIDTDGRVAFYNMWTHVPTLYEAIQALLKQDGRGVVNGGIDHVPHLLPSMTDGWKGLRRGLPQSLIDIETAGPGTGVGPWLGYQIRPLLAPLTLRAKPLPTPVKIVLTVAAVALLVLGARRSATGAG